MPKYYEVKWTLDDDGMLKTCEASNGDFTASELIGLFEIKKNDILRQIIHEIEPEIMFKRSKIVTEEEHHE